jgi:tetratricopeptide (TPR) repeat protein
MRTRVASARAAVLLLGLAVAATFQLPIGQAGVIKSQPPAYVAPPGNEDLIVHILRADGDSLRGIVKIRLATGKAVAAEVVTEPEHRHQARFRKIPLGPVRLQIVADGFATADLKLLLEHADREMRVTIYLRPETQGELRGEGWLPALSAAASAHYAKSVDSLRQGHVEKSRKQYGKLRVTERGDANLQYLAAVLDYRSNNTGMALFHFSQAAYLNAEDQDSARALAGLLYHAGIYSEAYEEFSRLAQKHPQDWELAWQAASAAFLSAQYSEARESAQTAFAHGGAMALNAECLLAVTDAMLTRWPEAREAATTVLTQSKDPALTATANALLAAMGPADQAGESGRRALVPGRAAAGLFSPDDFDPRVPLRLWAPPDVDGATPKIAQNTRCNTAEVLDLAGRRVVARLEKLGEVAAKDHIEQDVVGVTGRVSPMGNFTADYLPEALLLSDGSYAVEEFLAGVIPEPSPGSAVAQGRAGLALAFEPAMQPDFTFECEGLTQWKDRPAWSVHFTQRKDRPARLHAYTVSGRIYPAYIRGRGFVDQRSGELLHIETDLVDPISELGLEEEHLVVDYLPVTFHNVAEPFYLPSEAKLYVHIRGRFYRIREDFNEYVRFSVAVQQETKKPSGQE